MKTYLHTDHKSSFYYMSMATRKRVVNLQNALNKYIFSQYKNNVFISVHLNK